MKKRYLASIVLFLIAFVIAAYQGAVARPAEESEPTSSDVEPAFAETEQDAYSEEEPFVEEDDPSSAVLETNATVTHVVDGDTLDAVFDDGLEARIRFLGVNTPETVDPRKEVECFGKQASDFSKEMLSGARVLLAADPQADERDKYGRLLRNVYLEDGTDFNALLVEKGYAYAYLSFPLDKERKAELKRLENEAREAKRGLWAMDACESN
jgi:micrococcal nuclease